MARGTRSVGRVRKLVQVLGATRTLGKLEFVELRFADALRWLVHPSQAGRSYSDPPQFYLAHIACILIAIEAADSSASREIL
jgi:hypothetical protein